MLTSTAPTLPVPKPLLLRVRNWIDHLGIVGEGLILMRQIDLILQTDNRTTGPYVRFQDRLLCLDRVEPDNLIILEDPLQPRGAFSVKLCSEDVANLRPANSAEVRIAYQAAGQPLTNGWANRCSVPIDHAIRWVRQSHVIAASTPQPLNSSTSR